MLLGAGPARGPWTNLGRLPLRVFSIGNYAFLKLCCQWPDSDVTVDSEIIDLRVTINEPVESLSF